VDGVQVWNSLRKLAEIWEGTGTGDYPTIENFTYRELFEVTVVADRSMLHYLQQTWRTNVTPEAPSHIETGFIIVTPDGAVHVLNAQGPDRVEVLTGRLTPKEDGFVVDLTSTSLANDDRMLESWRRWTLDGDHFSYTMGMRTTALPAGANHLTAVLQRT
jgi:hypothetical protein